MLGPSSWTQYRAWAHARGRATRYDARSSWNNRYERAISEGRFDDAGTISRTTGPLLAHYSYNAVENAILELALRGGIPASRTVLDDTDKFVERFILRGTEMLTRAITAVFICAVLLWINPLVAITTAAVLGGSTTGILPNGLV